jgi:hypothetical protein
MGLDIPSSNKFRLGNEYSYRGTDAYCGDLFPLVRERGMEMTRALLTQAMSLLNSLEVGETVAETQYFYSDLSSVDAIDATITAIREYLATEREPVAWMHPTGGVVKTRYTGMEEQTYTIPLYTKEQL